MSLLRNLDELPAEYRGGVLTIGNFDGVHRGHARLVARAQELARQRGVKAVVLTFDPHPARLLRPDQVTQPLTTIEDRARLLLQHGANLVVAYPTDWDLLTLTPHEFFERVVRGRLQAVALVEGPNFRFGRDRSGDIESLRQLAKQASVELEVVEPSLYHGVVISSSWVRDRLRQGEVAEAAGGLGRPYAVKGRVVRSVGRGARLGFPTANLEEIATLIPGDGVYAARAWLGDQSWSAAVNIGPNPTFGETSRKVEVHLIGFQGEISGEILKVEFLARLRDTRAFASAEDLVAQLQRDVEQARRLAEEYPAEDAVVRTHMPGA